MGVAIGALALAAAVQASPDPWPVAASGEPVPMLQSNGQLCLPDADVCFAVEPDPERSEGHYRVQLTDTANDGSNAKHEALSYHASNHDRLEIWPNAIAVPGWRAEGQAWLVGVLRTSHVMYSGGGGDSTRLHLHLFYLGRTAGLSEQLLDLPWRASQLIRACFDERDPERRLGACHDEYEFSASLALDPDNTGGELPALIYRTQTTAFPQTARLWEDSSEAPPLTKDDLSHWTDFDCSYQRTLQFNPASRRYEMDRPAPDCAQYTDFIR